jgi:hypothetical protein
MASSINGCGTKYYGERDYRNDGSYLTTKFFCLLHLPIFPLHTVRVIPDPKNSKLLVVGTNHYTVLEKHAPNLLQTVSVYICELEVIALMVLYFVRIEPFLKNDYPWLASRWVAPIPFILAIAPPLIITHTLRSNARKRDVPQDMNHPTAIEPQ